MNHLLQVKLLDARYGGDARAFGYAEQGDLGVFAAIEFDGANEVPHVFDEQDIDLVQIEST